jgi:nitrite reductase/ring-hydroxylating ferredoxin subunit
LIPATALNLSRRQFVRLSLAAFAVGRVSLASTARASDEPAVNAGPVDDYAKDGIYDRHSQGFFIIRRGPALLAISSTCTHRKCALTAEADRTFYCKCHGSTFDPDGKVTEGPARRNLPFFATAVSENGQLLVYPQRIVGLTQSRDPSHPASFSARKMGPA